ncbi:MAG: hypothetical protein KAG53_06910 [Endozoicomonadaceae bacterium]|nr:hypothetical protein [Endozoicomonadaceae bacterium]
MGRPQPLRPHSWHGRVFLSSGSEYVHELNPDAQRVTFGQELNPESYAVCKALTSAQSASSHLSAATSIASLIRAAPVVKLSE